MDCYTTVRARAEAELTEKRSRFLAFAAPVNTPEQALAAVAGARASHRDARHHVWAYLLRDGSRRCSDDGEPQGTGGVPVLEVLAKSGLCDCVIVVTRYFGGVLLGAGGLVRAYSGAARLAVQNAAPVTLCPHVLCESACEYHQLGRVSALIGEYGALTDSVYGSRITLKFALPQGDADSFEQKLRELTAGSVEITRGGTLYMEKRRDLA